MYQELHKKAKKKVEMKLSFYICVIVFPTIAAILLLLSFQIPSAAFWLRLPIPLLFMTLAILYLYAFGLPHTGALSEDWQEEEIEREILRMYRRRKVDLPPEESLSESEKLELKELERLEQKWGREEDFV